MQIVRRDLDRHRRQPADLRQPVDPHQARTSAVHQVDLAIGSLGDRGPEVLVVQAHVIEQHAALGDGHGPALSLADVAEQLGDEQPVGREEVDVALVAVDGPKRSGLAAAGRDKSTQQPRGTDQLAGPIGRRRLVGGVQPGPETRIRPAGLAPKNTAQRLRRKGLWRHGQDRPAARIDQRLVPAGAGRRLRPGNQDFTRRQVVNRHALRCESPGGQSNGSVVDPRDNEGQVGHDRHAAHRGLHHRHFLRLHAAVAVGVRPDEHCLIPPAVACEIYVLGPARLERIALEQVPIVGLAQGRDGPGDPVAIEPKEGHRGAIGRVAVVAVREVPPYAPGGRLHLQRCFRLPARAETRGQRQIIGTRAEEDPHQLIPPSLPIELELHAVVVEASLVVRIQGTAAAVLGRAIKSLEELSFQSPDTHPLGLEIGFGNPKLSPGVDRQPVGVVHVVGVIRTGLGRAGGRWSAAVCRPRQKPSPGGSCPDR